MEIALQLIRNSSFSAEIFILIQPHIRQWGLEQCGTGPPRRQYKTALNTHRGRSMVLTTPPHSSAEVMKAKSSTTSSFMTCDKTIVGNELYETVGVAVTVQVGSFVCRLCLRLLKEFCSSSTPGMPIDAHRSKRALYSSGEPERFTTERKETDEREDIILFTMSDISEDYSKPVKEVSRGSKRSKYEENWGKYAKHTRIRLYNTLARPMLNYGSEARTLRKADKSRITACEMRFMRRTAGYTKWDLKRNCEILKELKTQPEDKSPLLFPPHSTLKAGPWMGGVKPDQATEPDENVRGDPGKTNNTGKENNAYFLETPTGSAFRYVGEEFLPDFPVGLVVILARERRHQLTDRPLETEISETTAGSDLTNSAVPTSSAAEEKVNAHSGSTTSVMSASSEIEEIFNTSIILRFSVPAIPKPSTSLAGEPKSDDNDALSESTMRISYKIFHEIANELKTFNEGEFIKRCLIILADELCPQQVGEVEAIRLSRRTVVRRLQEGSCNASPPLRERSALACLAEREQLWLAKWNRSHTRP
ncbi:hypothetical protein ANN_14105 [Periplaneta americana]|uniref:Uncharacterized protein n=1 Tax=Periplaneta americana TaxID=6978 RepID=A0ABQ8SWR3_PERAM|nr:hypothetical protein ANN_14105 [Periplaneta americana]